MYILPWASQMTLLVKNLPANAGDIRDRGSTPEESLETDMTTHSGVLAWRIPMDRGSWWGTIHRLTERQTHNGAQAHIFPRLKKFRKRIGLRDFQSGPVAKISNTQCSGPVSPWSGN